MSEERKRIQQLLAGTPGLAKELAEKATAGQLRILAKLGISGPAFSDSVVQRRRAPARGLENQELEAERLEAIVRMLGRPPLLVQNGIYGRPPTAALTAQLRPHRGRIRHVLAAVGRVNFLFHRLAWGGTGWMIAKNLLVTNRHVAELVADVGGFKRPGGGQTYQAWVDFGTGTVLPHEARLLRLEYLAAPEAPDIALFRVETPEMFVLPEPVETAEGDVRVGTAIGVAGYPAEGELLGKVYAGKRFAVGVVTEVGEGVIRHDATTLGWNSGSLLFELATGKAIGLQCAGDYLTGNAAVAVRELRKLKGIWPVSRKARARE